MIYFLLPLLVAGRRRAISYLSNMKTQLRSGRRGVQTANHAAEGGSDGL
jgi:hypothetical protein